MLDQIKIFFKNAVDDINKAITINYSHIKDRPIESQFLK